MSYIILLIISDITIIASVIYGWRQRSRRITRLFLLSVACLFIWITATILEYLSVTLATKLFWADIAFIGVAYVPVFWLLVVLKYTEYTGKSKRYRPLLFIIPTITNLLIWTNPWHHWWRGVPLLNITTSPLQIVDYDYQFWFHIHALYSLLLFVTSWLLLLKKLRVSKGVYYRQIRILLISTSLPLISELFYIMGLISLSGLSPTPIIFVISGLLLTITLFRYRFLDLMPIARDTLFEKMDDAMLAVDERCRIIDLNPSMQALLNVLPEEAIGHHINTLLTEREVGLATICDETKLHQEITIEQNGFQSQYDLQISPLQSSDENLTGQLIILHDITHRVRMENNLRLQNEELEAFSRTVAHDLRNPLSLVVGLNEIVAELLVDNNDPQVNELLDMIGKAAYKMDSIIESLLLLARVRQESIDLQQLDMTEILVEVVERLQLSISEVEATIMQPDSWPDVIGYAPWIEEVWVNYISNGLKYGGQPPHLILGFTVQEDDMIHFWVQDNGPGIDLSDQATLFTEFTRLNTTEAEGHGLGLSIVRRIITRLSGSVGVESIIDEGSTFYFNLPVTAVSEPYPEYQVM